MKQNNLITRSIGLCMAFFLAFQSYSQEIEYSPLQKKNGYFPDFYSLGGKNFFCTSVTGISRNLLLKHYTDFTMDADVKVSLKVNKKMAAYEGECLINNKFYVFMSLETDNVQKLYYQQFNTACVPDGDPVEIASYAVEKGKRANGFRILKSKNGAFFCIQYAIPSKKKEQQSFGYKIFNKELEVTGEGVYDSPYQGNQFAFSAEHLSDKGHLYIGVKVFQLNERGNIDRSRKLTDYVIYRVDTNGEMAEFHLLDKGLQITNKFISELTFVADDYDVLTLTGLYGNDGFGANGAFFIKVDFQSNEIKGEAYSEFSKDFITATFTDRQEAKAEKREERGKGSPELFSYDFREVQNMPDGGVVVVMEQYYVKTVTTMDSKGNSVTKYHYYYNDVIVYKVSSENKFDWIQRVRKTQHSVDDGGYLSSISGYFNGKEYVLFFNDSQTNYDESGTYKVEDDEKIAGARQTKNKNCVVRTVVDLDEGQVTRKIFTSREETDSYCVPKRFCVDYTNETVMMYFQTGTKEKFGLLKF